MATSSDPHVPASAIVARVITSIYREFEQVARASDISLAQYRLLFFLQGGPQRAGAIATAAALAKPTISLILNDLRERGWAENAPDPDGRAAVIVLTAAGKAKLASFEAALSAKLAEVIGDDAATEALIGGVMTGYAAMDARLTALLEAQQSKAESGLTSNA